MRSRDQRSNGSDEFGVIRTTASRIQRTNHSKMLKRSRYSKVAVSQVLEVLGVKESAIALYK